MKRLLLAFGALSVAISANAQITKSTVDYKDGNTVLQGYVARPAKVTKATPVVLVVHDWNGLDRYEESRVEQLAALGYIAFAVDIYGKGVRPTTVEACSAEAGKYYKDNALLRSRMKSALAFALKQANADKNRVAVIGYCFGGMVALDVARSGANVKGVVSFHGSLGTANPAQKGKVKSEVLVLHGAADPMVPQTQVDGLKKEMANAGVKCKVVAYPGAKHAFSVPGSEKIGLDGVGYNAEADKKSWAEMRTFFKRVLGR